MSNERRPSRMAPVFGGAALAVLMIGLAVGQAETITECQQCKSYWGYRAANDADKCLRYPFKSYTDHRGTCIQRWIDEKCKEICKNDVNLAGITTCEGMVPGNSDVCRSGAKGMCSMDSWGITCNSSDLAKRCTEVQVNPKGQTASNCHVDCVCR